MDYYVYRSGQHVRSFNTEAEGIEWVLEQIKQWRQSGASGHPEYKVCWNGHGATTLVTWKQSTFRELDAQVKQIYATAL
jgi:hypothetical protein